MSSKKVSELPYFPGQEFMIQLEARGLEICGGVLSDANSVILLGLINYLVENRIIKNHVDSSTK